MVKKRETILFSLVFILFIGFCASVSAGDVAYIYSKSFRIDDNIVNAIKNLGFTVDLIQENNIPSNLNNYKFIFVGDESFRDEKKVPVNKYPAIVVNYYHATEWGLADQEGVSLLAQNSPLSVRKDGRLIPAYTRAYASDGTALPYYYLDMEDKAPVLKDVAFTETTSSGSKFGTVIATADAGSIMANGKVQAGKLCFFGIVESDYWTTGSKNLFNECVGFVSSQCTTDNECSNQVINGTPFCHEGDVYQQVTLNKCVIQNNVGRCMPQNNSVLVEECQFGCNDGMCIGGKHDVALVDFSNSVQKIRLEYTNGTDLLGNTLMCNQEYKISVTVENKGDFIENVTFEGGVGSIEFEHLPIENLLVDDKKLKTKTVNFSLGEGNYNITVRAIIDSDDDLTNNQAKREVVVSCMQPSCFRDSDCGTDGFIGENMCVGKNVTRDYKLFTCNNAGTLQSSCTSRIEKRVTQICSDLCTNGQCEGVNCHNDEDCADSNPLTKDECINPGTVVSECRNTPINCAANADCGFSGFIGTEFCSVNNVKKNFQNAICNNAGTLQSSCSITVEQRDVNQCEFACSEGACIRCDTNADCDDSKGNTQDTCRNAGTEESFCTNEVDEEITCKMDSDCGSDQILSQPFCSVNDVNQLVRKWHCMNPDSVVSFCTSTIEQEVKQTCSNLCSDGRCVDIECFNNADCNDNNSTTTDICRHPGTEQSFCTNDNIVAICHTDSDCGMDGFISQNICFGNNVTRLFQDYTCNNPSTSVSFCSSELRQQVTQTCSNSCSNGECTTQTGECTPGQTRACGSSGTGECRMGTQTCESNGFYGSCSGAVNPVSEICDSKDNNCNGQTDEGNVCTVQCQDECSQTGLTQCSGNGYKTCGNTDSDSCLEWSTTVTNCAAGQSCTNGQCTNNPPQCIPSTEVCDNKDNDCDSSVDENFGTNTCGVGACQRTVNMCVNGQTQLCTPGMPGAETCNSVDDDCDGSVDEGGVCQPSCTNDCTWGNMQCNGNGVQVCGNFDSDSCSEWSSISQCGSGKVCELGQCINQPPQCSNECSTGSKQCSGNGYKVCGNYDSDSCTEWSGVSQCGTGKTCDNGQCVNQPTPCTNQCSDGTKQCSGNGFKVCRDYNGDGCTEWSSVAACGTGKECSSGECVPINSCTNKCNDGSRQCSGNGFQVCRDYNGDGCTEWSSTAQCGYGKLCQGGFCEPL